VPGSGVAGSCAGWLRWPPSRPSRSWRRASGGCARVSSRRASGSLLLPPRPWRAQAQPRRRPITPEQKDKLEQAARLRETGERHVRRREYAKSRQPLRQAIVLMDDVLREAPDGEAATAALYEKYRCYQLLGDYLSRESCFRSYVRQIRERDGDEAAARALLEDAQRLVGQGDTESAGRRVERAVALCPTQRVKIAAHVLLATAAERERLLDLAYSQYQMALAQNPSGRLTARIHRNMISINERRGKFDAAIADAEALCAVPQEQISLEDAIGHRCLLAHLYKHKGQTWRAIRVLHEVIANHEPEHTRYAQRELQRLLSTAVDKEILK